LIRRRSTYNLSQDADFVDKNLDVLHPGLDDGFHGKNLALNRKKE